MLTNIVNISPNQTPITVADVSAFRQLPDGYLDRFRHALEKMLEKSDAKSLSPPVTACLDGLIQGINVTLDETREKAQDFVGMTLEEAEEAAKDAGLTLRVAEEDGCPKLLTKDLRTDRVNVVVENGKVTSVSVG